MKFIYKLRPRYITEWFLTRKVSTRLSDKTFLKLMYFSKFGKALNLNAPKTFNEKLQWLKLYDRKDIYTTMVDKYSVKEYVADLIGDEYIIPTIGVWNSFDEIDFSKLPKQFVLKCTHDSGGLVICEDVDKLNFDKARKKISESLNRNYYLTGREWPYKNVVPRIIAEPYIKDPKTGELRDYKFFCFDGKVNALFIASERQSDNEETKFDFFDPDFNHLDIRNGHPNSASVIDKPVCFNKMKQLAEILSKGIPHVRVDFYEVDGKILFGELTFAHWSGFVPFDPEEWDYTFGEWIELPDIK